MATQLIIDPTSVSFEQIYDDIKVYVESKPDADAWKDFYDSGTGRTFIELIAGLATFRTFVTIAQRRETFLYHALARSSNIGIAENLQYSVIRGSSPHYNFTIVPSETRLLTKYELIGTYADYDIIVLEATGITKNVSIVVPVTIGKLKTEEVSVTKDSLTVFRFSNPDVSEDMILLLNDAEITYSRIFIQLASDSYISISNAFGGVDIMYLNTLSDASTKYGPGDTLGIKYITAIDILFDIAEIELLYGAYVSMAVVSKYVPIEPLSDIKINAPIHHQTANLIRGRSDYKLLLQTLISDCIDTNGRDVSAAVVELTYLLSDSSTLTPAEKASLIITLNTYRPFGVSPPSDITDPVQVDVAISISVTILSTATGVTQSSVETDIATILALYEKKFEYEIDVEAIERDINDLLYVKICRVIITDINNPWSMSTEVIKGEFVTNTTYNDRFYCCSVAGTTGTIEPVWNNIIGGSTIDGTVTWIAYEPNSTFVTSGWNEYFIFNPTVTLLY